jgi:Ser/Thr protein kinase RdoA (MazF antagonist)
MTAPIPAPLAVRYSTLSAAAAAEFVAAHYDLAAPLECTFLRRGFNDSFAVRDGEGRRYVLRLSGWRARGEADVAAETAFLVYLDGLGIPVAAPVRARDCGFFSYAMLPEGRRAAVLFRHAEGRSPRLDVPADAHAQGVTLARIHDAAPGFGGGAGRYRLDLDHLLHREVAAVLALDAADRQAKESLARNCVAPGGCGRGAGWPRLDALPWATATASTPASRRRDRRPGRRCSSTSTTADPASGL